MLRSMTDRDFDLNATMQALVDETDLTEPDDFAERLYAAIPHRQRGVVLRHLLRGYARNRLAWSRGHQPPAVPTTPNRSAKVMAIRTVEAARWLRDRVFVGDRWLLVGDCSRAHVTFLKDASFKLAARHYEIAEKRWASLESLMAQHGADRVRDLPADVLASFDWAAAA